jgi:hypothetical protein
MLARMLRSSLLTAGVILLWTAPAAAVEPEACIASYERGQRLRKSGKLVEAEPETRTCADESCPVVLKRDCIRWLDELHRATPTIAVTVVGNDGCDHPADLTLDGEAIVARPGRAIPVNPGEHVVRAQLGSAVREQRIVLPEGEQARRLAFSFAPAGVTCGTPTPEPAAEKPQRDRPVPPLVWVLGGVGAAALITGAVLGVSGFSQKSTLDDCRPRCASDDVDSMQTTFLAADIVAGVGLVSLAAATWLFFTRPQSEPLRTALAW